MAMIRIFEGKLKITTFDIEGQIELCSKRAGNPFSVDLCEVVPRSIDKLACSPAGGGHDKFLRGIFVHFDWKINKIIREQLLNYNFINGISSQSLMHNMSKIAPEYRCVDDVPLGFEYWISFACNYAQLKTIYAQRKNHTRQEWRLFCEALRSLPRADWIINGD